MNSGAMTPSSARLSLLLVWVATTLAQRQGGTNDVWVVSGKRAELPCTVNPREDDQPVLVLWYRAGNTRKPVFSYDARSGDFHEGHSWADHQVFGSRASFNPHADPPVLILKRVLASDQGLYTCRVDYILSPSTTTRANLTVAVLPGAPRVVWRGTGVPWGGVLGPLEEGSHVELLCRSTGGRPKPQVTWWWRGAKLPSQHTSLLHHGEGAVESSLVISAARELHGAKLTCQAQTPTPSTAGTLAMPQPLSVYVFLNVTLPPLSVDIAGWEGPMTAGSTVTLECLARGSHPPPIFTWRLGHIRLQHVVHKREGEGDVTKATLKLKVRREDDGATLSCTASNPLLPHAALTATRTLQVFYVPVVSLNFGRHVDSTRLQEGNDVFFECQVRANPPPTRLHWYHNGVEVEHDVTAGVVVSGLSLAVQQLKREHSGHYTCAATNIEGHNTSNAVQLTVKHAPVCDQGDTQRTLGVARGTPIIVTCRVEAEPVLQMAWTWVRVLRGGQGVPVPADAVTSAGLTSSVEITPLTEHDYGKLLCRARNTVGWQREACVVNLVPAGPPDPPFNCSATLTEPNVPADGELLVVVTCLEGFDGGLPQEFVLEAWQNSRMMTNSSSDFPEWVVSGLNDALDTTLLIAAVNARGRSETLRLEVSTTRAQQQAAPETEALSVPALLGAAAGVVLVLVLSLVVSVMLARHKCSRGSKDTSPNERLEATPAGSVWKSYEPEPLHQAQGKGAKASLHPATPLTSHQDPARTHMNGCVLRYSPQHGTHSGSCQSSDSCSNSSYESKAESVVEVSRFTPQCWHEQAVQPHLTPGSSHASLPRRGSPKLDVVVCQPRPGNGYIPCSTPHHTTRHLQNSQEAAGPYPIPENTNYPRYNSPKNLNGRKHVQFQDGKKTIVQQNPCPPKVPCPAGSPVTVRQLQASPVQTGKSKAKHNFHPPRKPPRAYSQTSLTNSPRAGGSYSSLCSSASQPAPHTHRGPEDWSCPQAPLAEDEVKDAYALLQSKNGWREIRE